MSSLPHGLLPKSGMTDATELLKGLSRLQALDMKLPGAYIDYDVDRGLDRNLIQRLADLGFMSKGRNLFIVGSTGTGKSYIATALGYRACQKGHRVLYANTARLMAQLKVAKAKGEHLAGTQENRTYRTAHSR